MPSAPLDLAAIPPILPRRDGMAYVQLYAKELDVLTAVDAHATPGDAVSVIHEIENWVTSSENWLKLAGGDKALALEHIVEARRPRLIIEVGFYVGYPSPAFSVGTHHQEWHRNFGLGVGDSCQLKLIRYMLPVGRCQTCLLDSQMS